MNLCLCGCGEETKTKFVWGHNSRVDGYRDVKSFCSQEAIKRSRETIRKQFIEGREPWMKGKTHTDVAKQANAEKHIGRRSWNAGKTKEDLPQLSNSGRKNGGRAWNKDLTKEVDTRLEQLSKSMKQYHIEHPEAMERLRLITLANLSDPVYVRKIFARREQTGPELFFEKFCHEHGFPFVFNGGKNDNFLVIERKVPDFVHCDEKKLIEIWGNFYHKGQEPSDRITFFKERGYDCLVLWASELRKVDLVLRVASFAGGKTHGLEK